MTLNRSLRKVTWKVCVLPLLAGLLPGMGEAQVETVKPAVPTIEPGLELAVKWPWQVQASDAATWGIPVDVPEETVTIRAGIPVPQADAKKAPAKVAPKGPPPQMIEHTVAKGDSLTKIAHANGVTIDQLRIFNDLKNDRIVIGQVVKVPGEPDIAAMIAAAAEAEKEAAKNKPKGKEAAEPKKKPTPVKEEAPPVLIATKPHRALPPAAWGASSLVLIQAYLDRQGFTIGPIDGTAGPMYDAAYKSFEKAYPGQLHTPEGQPSAAMRSIGGPYVEYMLTAADMRWISPHDSAPAGGKAKGAKAVEPPPTFEELSKEPFMAYRSGWEFVAEKFHAAESFLRHINPGVKNPNAPGAIFLVPNVLPFEIEKAFEEPLQPAADPAAPVSASVVGFNRLIIHKGEKIVANMPLSAARPGLRGRKTWKILDVIPRPAMASTGDPAAPMTVPYRLHSGPNNPVGILWINLAKSGDPKVLPYGLHGTSIPGAMTKQESIGGFRMTNWDIARVVRLLPAGTDLKWE